MTSLDPGGQVPAVPSVPKGPDAGRPTAVDPALPANPGLGVASKTGLGATVLLAVLAAIDALAGDVIDNDTKFLIGSAVATTIVTVGGRMYQQGKLYAARAEAALEKKYGDRLP